MHRISDDRQRSWHVRAQGHAAWRTTCAPVFRARLIGSTTHLTGASLAR
jgi:hypothetical protein